MRFSCYNINLCIQYRVAYNSVSLFQAVVLCEYLDKNRQLVAKKRVLELGAGTGLVGIFCGMLGKYTLVWNGYMSWHLVWNESSVFICFLK